MPALTVGTSAAQVPAAGRQRPLVQNLGPGIIYLGEANTVTTANGIKLAVGAAFEFLGPVGPDGGLWIISDTVGTDVRYMTMGG